MAPLLLVAMPGAPSSVLAPSSQARSPASVLLVATAASLLLVGAPSSDARSR